MLLSSCLRRGLTQIPLINFSRLTNKCSSISSSQQTTSTSKRYCEYPFVPPSLRSLRCAANSRALCLPFVAFFSHVGCKTVAILIANKDHTQIREVRSMASRQTRRKSSRPGFRRKKADRPTVFICPPARSIYPYSRFSIFPSSSPWRKRLKSSRRTNGESVSPAFVF